MRVPAAKVIFSDADVEGILEEIKGTLKSGMLTLHEKTKEFENEFSQFIGTKYAIATNSGTSALEIILRSVDVAGREVIIPTNTFAATVFAAISAGAKVRFCDIDGSFSIDVDKVKEMINNDTKAVIVVHIGGMISPRIEELRDLCKEKKVILVEDAAHAHGSSYKDMKAGSIGEAGSFSFYPTKVMTSAEGGMITTNDDKIAEMAMKLRDQGKESFNSNKIGHLGYNWRMSEVHAIIGKAQLKNIDKFIEDRRKAALVYDKELEGGEGLSVVKISEGVKSNYYKYLVLLDDDINRDELKKKLKQEFNVGLSGEVYDEPCHKQPAFSNLGGEFPKAEQLCKEHICLPVYATMTEEEAKHVVESLKKAIDEIKKGDMS